MSLSTKEFEGMGDGIPSRKLSRQTLGTLGISKTFQPQRQMPGVGARVGARTHAQAQALDVSGSLCESLGGSMGICFAYKNGCNIADLVAIIKSKTYIILYILLKTNEIQL